MTSIASGDGPIQVNPASMIRLANSAFSAKKPYPGWTGVRSGVLGRPQDRIDVQIGFGGGRAGKVYRMIRLDHVRLGRVGIRVDHRFDVHPTAGAEHAAGDLTAVCDQEFSDHRHGERTGGNLFLPRRRHNNVVISV